MCLTQGNIDDAVYVLSYMHSMIPYNESAIIIKSITSDKSLRATADAAFQKAIQEL